MTLPHPGLLKLELATAGVQVSAACRDRPELQTTARSTVELLLPEDLIVDAPVRNGDAATARPYRLECEHEQFFLLRRDRADERIEVRVIPPPRFYEQCTTQGTPMREIATVFGSFLALSPIGRCSLSLWGRICPWCAETEPTSPARAPHTVADVIDTVRAAFAEGAVEFVLFNTASPGAEDGGVEGLEPYVTAVKRHFDTVVAVQAHPPRSDRWIDRTYAMGVDAIDYGVEIHDAAVLARMCPRRRERVRERYDEALAYAASIFPGGTVWSDLLVGPEPPQSTMAGIDRLVALGALPVLSFAAAPAEADARELAALPPVVAHLFEAVRQARINMGWVQELSFGITPLEARFFAGDDARLSVAQQFYRSRLGNLAARNLARLRRRLRVRTVSDSFDSSHL